VNPPVELFEVTATVADHRLAECAKRLVADLDGTWDEELGHLDLVGWN
jgi:hypothetical protein